MPQPAVAPQQAYEYLSRALLLLRKPQPNHEHSWIQHALAIDETGNHCNPESEHAVAWCTLGVVKAVTHYDPDPAASSKYIVSLLNMANPTIMAHDNIPAVNDSTTFQHVCRMFEKAMSLAIRFGA